MRHAKQSAAQTRLHHLRAVSLFAVSLFAIALLMTVIQGCTRQSAAFDEPVAHNTPQDAPGTEGESLILLLSNGPLTPEPAPAFPPLELGARELVLNADIIPEVTIQSGLLMRPIYEDSATGHSFSVVTWPASASLKRHWHPSTERLWMLEGSITSPNDGKVGKGMFWEAPARVAMGPFTSTGSAFVFLGEGPFETYYLEDGEEAPRSGNTITVNPDDMPWQPLASITGAAVEGSAKVLSARTQIDRGAYLVKLPGTTGSAHVSYEADIEGYVLDGEIRFTDPYHGTHLLTPGHYFRIPAGFPSSLLAASE